MLDDLSVHDAKNVEDVDPYQPAVGGWPMNEPSLVPVATFLVHTRSPDTARSSIVRRKSEKARRNDVMTAFTPAGPGGWWGP